MQVLAREGASRLTMARVAERAGVSVGSLYQYFPNKAALLFRLQRDEWQQTTALLKGILEDAQRPPLARLRALVHAFIRSECDEAAVRGALEAVAPRYADAPEARAARDGADETMQRFVRECLPAATDDARSIASAMLLDTLSALGSRYSAEPRTPDAITAYADGLADMFCAYLSSLDYAEAKTCAR